MHNHGERDNRPLNNIVWLGDLGFPIGLATIQKTLLMCRSLQNVGVETLVISRYGIHPSDYEGIKQQGEYQGVKYIYASGTPYRPKSFLLRNFLKLKGLLNEIFLLYKFKKNDKLDAIIVRTSKFTSLFLYKLISIITNVPIVLLYHELYSSINEKKGGWAKIDANIYEKVGFLLCDGVMPISDFLMDYVQARSPATPLMKVPVITDFKRFQGRKHDDCSEKYFLYCGGAAYLEVIKFVMKSYDSISDANSCFLYLVVNGNDRAMNHLWQEVQKLAKRDTVKVFSKLSDNKLTEFYNNAIALIIPLRDTLQDRARFPHKIGEYLASGNPIVTTNYGEVKKYFKDCETALIAEKYDVELFAEKLEYILLNPEKSKRVGQAGQELGYMLFDYDKYGIAIKNFILSLQNSKFED